MAPHKCSDEFEKSYKLAKYLQHASQEDMLDLYAWAIIAKQDKDIETTPKPNLWDMPGKAKRRQWQKYVNEKWSAEKAETEYIAKINNLVKEHGLKDECPADLK